MGNNIRGGCRKAAKVMKINGEYFKLKTPTKAIDIIKDYPDHILIDSEDFMRYNLRANPLSLEDELRPNKIYLLFELPSFPDSENAHKSSPLRRVRSGVGQPTTPKELMSRRSISDLSIVSKSTATANSDSDDGGAPTRVRMRLPKTVVKRIMEESSGDDVEVAREILKLIAAKKGGGAVVHAVLEGKARGDVVVDEEKTAVIAGDLHPSML